MFSVVLGEEATVEILQCKQLGNAAVHQVPLGRAGGTWWKIRSDKSLGDRLIHFWGKVGKETKLESNPSLNHFSCLLPLSYLAVRKSTSCSHSQAKPRLSPGSYLKKLY